MQNIERAHEQLSETKSERQEASEEIKRYFTLAGIALRNGGEASFEWPSNHSCWALGVVADFLHQHKCYTAIVGDKRFACTSHRLAVALQALGNQMLTQFHQNKPIDVKQGGAAAESETQVNGCCEPSPPKEIH